MVVHWQGLHGRHLSQQSGYVCLHMPASQTLRILCEQLCCHSAASRRLIQAPLARNSRQRAQAAKEEVAASSDNLPEASGALEQVVAPQQSEAQAAESRCDVQAVSRSGYDACNANVRVRIQPLHVCNLCICTSACMQPLHMYTLPAVRPYHQRSCCRVRLSSIRTTLQCLNCMPGSVLDPSWVRRLRLDGALMQQLSELPGTKHLLDLHDRALVLSQWRVCPTPRA